jgi:hypothetical protein
LPPPASPNRTFSRVLRPSTARARPEHLRIFG